jgi:protocatechuate 3,4-dioxygenase beta subunit
LPGTVAATGRIAGRVTTEGGRPIKGASLFVVRTDGQSMSKPARTDAQGRFAVTELPAGRFQVSAAADRYLGFMFGQRRSNEPGTPIELIEGGSFTTADIRLPRQVGIEGTILDEFGDPAPSVTVVPARWMYAGGRKRIIPMEGRGLRQTTDDRGHYRIYGLAPGDYFVTTQVGIFGDAIDLGGYAPTYYPGTADGSAATTVQPTTGADVLNASFSLVAVRTVTVSGFAVDGGGQPVSGAAVTLSLSDRAGRAEIRTTRAAAGSDGRFVLANVPPGPYTLQGFGPPPTGGRQPWPAGDFGWTPISVGDADIDDVVIRITPGRALRGRFMKEETEGPPIVFEKVRMTLLPVETDSSPIAFSPPPSTFREDGTFELTNLTGLRRLMVTTMTPAWALKRITLNGRDVTDVPFDFREKDVEGLEIVLTSKVTTVTGGVVDNKGQPLSDYAVVLFTSDPTKWGERSRFVTVARPAQRGEFSVRGLPPDDYLAVALPLVNGTEHYDPAFLDPLRPIATAFTLSDGESKTLSLKLKNRQ